MSALLGTIYQGAANRANRANERRYRQALREAKNLRRRNLRDVRKLGQTAEIDINTGARNRQAQVRQELTSRGLAHSTVLPTMLTGVDRERARSMIALKESMAGQRMQARTGGTDRIMNVIQSKVDAAPDPGMLAQLAQGMGAGGMGGDPYGGMNPYGGGGGFQMDPRTIMQQQLMQQAWQQQAAQRPGPSPWSPSSAASRLNLARFRRLATAQLRNQANTQRSVLSRQQAMIPRTKVNLGLWK